MSFASLGLAESLVRAVHDKGYTQPTPIQSQAIPAILEGRDIMAAAQTGTGKTAGFTLPLLQRLLDGPKTKPNHVRALVLTPTRELAAQVQESVETYGAHLPLRSTVVFGGVSINPQMKDLRRGVDVLVATPGRLLDLHQQNAIKFSQIETLVLDEADRMLDMGFIHDIKKILNLLPKQRQNLMFSATFSGDIRNLAKGLVNDPLEIDVAPRNSTTELVEQVVHPVDKNKKAGLLSHLIRTDKWTQAIVFTRTKHGANKLVDYLMRDGITAAAIHSNKSQGARTRALNEFKNGEVSILVATDIAARGLDIPQLPQVVNFDLPNVPEDYVHRIGRTGRAGETGHAISLVDAEESRQLADIERLIKRKITRQVIGDFTPLQSLPEGKAASGQREGSRTGERRQQQGQNKAQQPRQHNGQAKSARQGDQRNQPQQQGKRRTGGGEQRQGQGQGQARKQQDQRTQGRRLSHVDKALASSPMTQRIDPTEEHRRAQALGNRIAPEPEQPRKSARQPRDNQQQAHGQRQNAQGQRQRTEGGQKRQGQQRQPQQQPRSPDAPPKKTLIQKIKSWSLRTDA
jgi:ATP-dependent RNA helicase RhlE